MSDQRAPTFHINTPMFIEDPGDVHPATSSLTFAERERMMEETDRLAALVAPDLVEYKFECKECGRTLPTTSVKTRDRGVCCGCYVIEALNR